MKSYGKFLSSSCRRERARNMEKKKKKVRSTADEFQGPKKRRRATMVKPDDSKSSGFDKLTEDLFMQILVRLPAKLVTRCMCVSKLWYSLISTPFFNKLFIESPSSAKPPRLLMSLVDMTDQRKYAFLSSSSQHDHSDTTAVSVIDRDLDMHGMEGYLVNVLRGLLCLRLETRVRICNPTTNQLVELPIIRSSILAESNDNIWSYFGYDPVNDEYKVLSTVWKVNKEEERVVISEHQVLVLGAGATWRKIPSHVPHRPYSQGISVNGVLYYGAWVGKNTCVVMSFHLASEEFHLIELPVKAGIVWHTYRANLINYGGKLAVFEYSRLATDATVDLWVLEDAGNNKWSNKTLVLPLSLMNFVHGDHLGMQGMGRPGEVMLSKIEHIPFQPKPCVIYNLENNKITRRFELKPPGYLWLLGISKGYQATFWEDDTESIMYLET